MSLRLVVALSLLSLAFIASSQAQITFAAPVDYNVGAKPASSQSGMVAADFNGDGYPDIAVVLFDSATSINDQIAVLKNNGDGTFGTPTIYLLPGGNIQQILAADLTGNGSNDLVAGSGEGGSGLGFYVLINNGDGTFQPPVFYAEPAVGQVGDVAWVVGDFFGHGRFDVMDEPVGLFGQGLGLDAFINNGNGTFTFVADVGTDMTEYGLWVADFNGDGLADVASGNAFTGCVPVALGNGNGTFGPTTCYSSGGQAVTVGDFGSPTGGPDGFPDVVANNYGGIQIEALINMANGTGTFEPTTRYNLLTSGPGWILLSDLEGNGSPDLAAGVGAGPGNIVANLVKNNFGSGGGFTYISSVPVSYVPTSQFGTGIGIDLNGDGLPDLVSSDPAQNNIHVLINTTPAIGSNPRPIQFLPSSLTFPPLTIAKTSIVRTVTLNYLSGVGLLDVSSVSVSGDFALARNLCPSMLAAGGNCTLSFTFTPTATGTRTGTLTITDNQAGSPHTFNISGTGKDPAVTFSALNSFGKQLINTTSMPKTVTVKNSGIGDLVIGTVSASGDFSTSADTCSGKTVAQGKTCTVSVAFTPSVAGAINGMLTVTDDGRTSPQVLSLSGTGVNPFSIAPASLAFGTVSVGTTSTAKMLTLTNNTTVTVTFASPTSGDFATVGGGSSPCGNSLAGGSSCTISVTFSPTQKGGVTGSLIFYTTDGYVLTLPVALSGTGSGGATAPLTFSPLSLKFASQGIGTVSSPVTMIATNKSKSTVTIQSLANSPDYTVTGSGTTPCGGALEPNATCTFQVAFSPTGLGTIDGAITITTDNSVSPQIYGLSGTGILPVTFSPASLKFAAQTVGTTSPTQTVTMTNNQTATLNIAAIQASGQYSAVAGGATPCGSALAPQSSCTFTVTFTPSVKGTIPGVVTVSHNAGGSPQEIRLTGTGQ